MSRATLIFSAQCPNCTRFIEALARTPIARDVAMMDVATLSRDQLSGLVAVPSLVTDGQTLCGTKAFEWLKQFEAEVEVDGFSVGSGSLAFSDVSNAQGYATYADDFSTFEPIPE